MNISCHNEKLKSILQRKVNKLIMRDKKRIKKFCDELATIWENKCPDFRFGQMICNIFNDMAVSKRRDPFFPEEDEMINYIKNYFNWREN